MQFAALVFTYEKSRFSHEAAHFKFGFDDNHSFAAKCLDKLCSDQGLKVLCLVVIFFCSCFAYWSGIKLCVTQCSV